MRYFRSKIYNSIYLEMEADNAETACERAMAVYGSGALDNIFFDAQASYDGLVLSEDISDISERDVYSDELYHTLLEEMREPDAKMKPSMSHEEFLKRLSSFGFSLEEECGDEGNRIYSAPLKDGRKVSILFFEGWDYDNLPAPFHVSLINENGNFDFYQEYMPWHYDIVLEGFEKNFEFLSGGGK